MYNIEVKKRANSRKYTPVKEFKTEQEVIDYLNDNGLEMIGTPYIFTHINLSDGSILTQHDDRFGMILSPVKMRDLLLNRVKDFDYLLEA